MVVNGIQLLWTTVVCVISPVAPIQIECESDITGFRDVSQLKTYIDKTLMVKELFAPPAMKMVTAPHRCGKSTNLDMMRRFLQVPVDSIGERLPYLEDTATFKLFCSKKRWFKICDDKFFNKHFGQYPVIFIDYKIMNDANSLYDMTLLFRTVVMYAFADHVYLAKAKDLWPRVNVMTRKQFEQVSDPEVDVSEEIIRTALKRLSHILYLHYGRPAYVLIDEYNCYLEYLLIDEGIEDAAKMIDYYQSVNHYFLKSNPYIQGVFITGVYHVVSGWGMSYPTDHVQVFGFSRNHRFNQYYGMSRKELEALLQTRISDENERSKLVEHIDRTYGGYQVMGQDTVLYNIFSALEYLQHRRSNKTNYWMRPNFITGPCLILYLKEVMEPIIKLLQRQPICIDISTPLTKAKLDLLNGLHGACYDPGSVPNTLSVQTYFYLLFELGFLTVYNGAEEDEHMVRVRIPNLETEEEFVQLLLDMVLYKFVFIDVESIKATNGNLSSITEHTVNETVIGRAFQSMHDIFWKSNCFFQTINEFRRVLYVVLRKGLNQVYTWTDETTPQDLGCDILVINDHKVNFCIDLTVKSTDDKDKRDEIAARLVTISVNRTAARRPGQKTVYVGVCYSKYTKQMSVCYTKPLRDSDPLDEIYTVSLSEGPFKNETIEELSSCLRNSSESIDISYIEGSSPVYNSTFDVKELVSEYLGNVLG